MFSLIFNKLIKRNGTFNKGLSVLLIPVMFLLLT